MTLNSNVYQLEKREEDVLLIVAIELMKQYSMWLFMFTE